MPGQPTTETDPHVAESLAFHRDRVRFYMTCGTVLLSGGVGATIAHFIH
jgi:hypothetical protein